jgi:phosphate transport system substrate-binding protein
MPKRARFAHIAAVAYPTAVACLAAAVLAGCGGSEQPAVVPTPPARIRVSGSGTALPLLRLLASAQKEGSGLVFLPGLHTGGGVKGVAQGSLDIGAVSRDLNREEAALGLTMTWLSSDALVIAANPAVGELGVTNLTTQQLKDIYTGKITDWEQVGAAKKMRIDVLDRHEDESAKIFLRRYVLGRDLKITDRALPLYYESDMVEAIQSTPGAIGYFSLGYAISQDIPVTRLRLDGVEASVANVESGRYRVVRPLGFVTKKGPPQAVSDFVDWATSDEARKVMTTKGYAPYMK